ncbi:cation:proton antiporter [Halobacterium wangiae]|uniref:cation:proton antiporter domain-containing protein n=1 Tax=Halobacterium wangiae TaxID=2902623 RepID=UPI001E5C2D30|nr:cation:proton antiporter [Halobacterium wangiae]
MSQFNLWLTVLGGLTLLLVLGAGVMKTRIRVLSQPIVAVLVGVAVGPRGLDLLQTTAVSETRPLLEEVARLTVAFAVTSIALRLDPAYFRARARSLAVLVGPGMVLMWLLSALVAYAVLPVGPVVALLVGAVVTPTDPVLANSIVVGETATENIPRRLRYLLSGEAGINDGTAYLFVLLPVLLMAHPVETALGDWLTRTFLWEVLGAVVVGFAIGSLVGAVEQWENTRDFLEETSVFTLTVALTFFVLGATKLAGTDDILAVFVAGAAYNWRADPQDEANEQRVEEVFNRLFTIPVFVLFGIALPWSGWVDLGWRAPALVAGVLLFRRLPVILALRRYVPPLDRRGASLFVGWFGPIGIAAVFYAVLAAERTGAEVVWVAASLVAASSVLVHGVTAVPATLGYGRLGDDDESW